jgi:hypothetical protein
MQSTFGDEFVSLAGAAKILMTTRYTVLLHVAAKRLNARVVANRAVLRVEEVERLRDRLTKAPRSAA